MPYMIHPSIILRFTAMSIGTSYDPCSMTFIYPFEESSHLSQSLQIGFVRESPPPVSPASDSVWTRWQDQGVPAARVHQHQGQSVTGVCRPAVETWALVDEGLHLSFILSYSSHLDSFSVLGEIQQKETAPWKAREVRHLLCSLFPHGGLMSQRDLFQHFAVLVWGRCDMCKVTVFFLPLHCIFSHFCVPLGCCNLSPGFQSSNKGNSIDGWLLNWFWDWRSKG